MTELSIRPDDIAAALRKHVESFRPTVSREEVGRVTETGDGIARVEGLPSVMTNELLEFEGGVRGLALNLESDNVGVVLFGEWEHIVEGDTVKRTGKLLEIPVGDALLGRIVDPLGNPVDALGEVENEGFRELELQAPNVISRQSVSEPLQTGIKAIDSMTPIGRGQRQLIIGDRKTGKTAVCVDTIINQKQNWATGDPKQQVRCIYVAIGQKGSTVAAVRAALEEAGAATMVVYSIAPASSSAARVAAMVEPFWPTAT